MAVSTNVWFSNAIVGVPQVGADVNIYEQHTSPKFAIGQMYERHDGSRYRYSHIGSAIDIPPARMLAQDVSESGQTTLNNKIVAPASCQTTTDGTTGSYFMEITLAGVTADQFAGGYCSIPDKTGQGYIYRIKGNTAVNNPATGNFRLHLEDPLVKAVDATSDLNIMGSRWANLEQSTCDTDNVAAGVTLGTWDVSTSSLYGWVQTKGVAAWQCTADDQDLDTVAIGDGLILDDHGRVGVGTTAVAIHDKDDFVATVLVVGSQCCMVNLTGIE